MLTKTEAKELVSIKLQQMGTLEDPFVLVEKHTIEKSFGWVFFYNSKKFMDTGISLYRIAGNGPVIVNKNDRTVLFCGTSKPPEQMIKDYENNCRPAGNQ